MAPKCSAFHVAAVSLLCLGAARGDAAQVAIENFTFGPGIMTVGAGTTVVWVNRDDIPHTVTGLAGAGFRSGALDTGDEFKVVFAQTGTFRYFCTLHPRMQGTVVVK